MILDTDDKVPFGGPPGPIAQNVDDELPLLRVNSSRIVVSSEDAENAAAEIAREPGEFENVLHVDLAVGYFAVFEIRRQVAISRDANGRELARLYAAAQRRTLTGVIVED